MIKAKLKSAALRLIFRIRTIRTNLKALKRVQISLETSIRMLSTKSSTHFGLGPLLLLTSPRASH